MEISSQITVSIKPDLNKSFPGIDAFRPGSFHRLKVLELKGDRALIDFGHFRATADIRVPVTLGDELLVKVLESGKQLKLSVINPEHKNPLSADLLTHRDSTLTDESFKKVQIDLKQIFNQTIDHQSSKASSSSTLNILDSLNSHFESFDLKNNIASLVPRLKSYLENSGIFFEKMLGSVISRLTEDADSGTKQNLTHNLEVKTILTRDLKFNLLMLQHLVEDKQTLEKSLNPKALATLRSSIDTLLSGIARQQGRAVRQLASAEPFQAFTYALPLEEGTQTARLKVYYEKKQKSESKKGFRISLLLSLDRLGDIRTDFYLLGNNLAMTFFVKEHSTKVEIQESYPAFKELLNGLFDQVQVKVLVSEKKIKDFDDESVQVAGDRRVDLRI